MDWIIHEFLEVTTVGSFWTPVVRFGLLALAVNEIVIVLLILFRNRARSWIASLKQRMSFERAPGTPPEWPPNT